MFAKQKVLREKKMGKGKALPPEVVEQIKVSIASGMNYTQTANELQVPVNTISTIMKRIREDEELSKEFEELKAKKKKEMQAQAEKDFDKKMNESFKRLFEKSMQVIEEGFEEKLVTPKDAMIILGTSFDKRRLLMGQKTSDVAVQVSYEEVLKKINEGSEF